MRIGVLVFDHRNFQLLLLSIGGLLVADYGKYRGICINIVREVGKTNDVKKQNKKTLIRIVCAGNDRGRCMVQQQTYDE